MPEAIDSDICDELRTIALGGSTPAGARPIELRVAAAAILGALIALDAPPATYVRHVSDALAAGITTGELLAILTTVTPHVGAPRATAAAAEIMLALGLPLDEAL
jgi:alkylhydroperoxidase/carboxymuconolactone decarboxylase family protein YurZ